MKHENHRLRHRADGAARNDRPDQAKTLPLEFAMIQRIAAQQATHVPSTLLQGLRVRTRTVTDGVDDKQGSTKARATQPALPYSMDADIRTKNKSLSFTTDAPLSDMEAGKLPGLGANGDAVKYLQSQLMKDPACAALLQKHGGVDGKFGAATEAALAMYKQKHAIGNDADAATLASSFQANGGTSVEQFAQSNQAVAAERGGQGGQGADVDNGAVGGATPQSGGTGAGARALDVARSQVGVREATGNNDGIPAERYSNGRREPWCANFVTWAYKNSGKSLPGGGSPSVQVMEDKMRAAGQWSPRGQRTPQPGDVIFFANRGGSDAGGGRHVGIVSHVANGRVYTVEGNSGNAVSERSHDLNSSRITGYGWN
jgi:hypothetical protein